MQSSYIIANDNVANQRGLSATNSGELTKLG